MYWEEEQFDFLKGLPRFISISVNSAMEYKVVLMVML